MTTGHKWTISSVLWIVIAILRLVWDNGDPMVPLGVAAITAGIASLHFRLDKK